MWHSPKFPQKPGHTANIPCPHGKPGGGSPLDQVILAGNSLGGYLTVLATAFMEDSTLQRIKGREGVGTKTYCDSQRIRDAL